MLSEKAKEYFKKYNNLKILFFFDENKDHEDEIKTWDVEAVKLIIADKHYFNLKYKLEYELQEDKVFLYFPFSEPKGDDRNNFPIMDLMCANKVMHIDDVADFMEEFGLKPNQRKTVAKHIKLLKTRKNKTILAPILIADRFDEANVKRGLLSGLLGFNKIEDDAKLIIKLLVMQLNKDESEFPNLIQKVQEIDAEALLVNILTEYLEYESATVDRASILISIKKLKYNLITQHISNVDSSDTYGKLKINSASTINKLNALTNEWTADIKHLEYMSKIFSSLAGDISEEQIVKNYGMEANYGYYTEPLAYIILDNLLKQIIFQPDKSLLLLQRLHESISSFYVNLKTVIEFLYRVSNIYKILNSTKSFVLNTPKEYLLEYVGKFEKIDYYYRKCVILYEKIRILNIEERINLEETFTILNNKYEDYLKELNSEWLKCNSESGFDFNNIAVKHQSNFYDEVLSDSENKVAVIISDALRYEAANELLGVLHSDVKNTAAISFMLSSLPSNTKTGMANLLPNKNISYNDNIYSIDGISTEGLENREKILQVVEQDSKVVSFGNLAKMNQNDSRELFKSKFVYIYHNTIDAIGDDRKTESKTFEAVDTAIKEITPLIKKIHSSYNVSKIIVTSDHGFLFNYQELSESMYEPLPDSKDGIVNHNRFSIVKKEVPTNSYVFNLSLANKVNLDLKITIPKAVNRYKRQGHGTHFVHGGASLQEMVIPLIVSSRKREDVSEKVTFKVLQSNSLKIVSGALKVKLIQEKAISSSIKSIRLSLGLYGDGDELISNESMLILESASDLPTERMKETILNLNSNAGKKAFVYLKIFDVEKDVNKLNPLFSEKIINHTLIEPEF